MGKINKNLDGILSNHIELGKELYSEYGRNFVTMSKLENVPIQCARESVSLYLLDRDINFSKFKNLNYIHFKKAIYWDDGEFWLEKAERDGLSPSQMFRTRSFYVNKKKEQKAENENSCEGDEETNTAYGPTDINYDNKGKDIFWVIKNYPEFDSHTEWSFACKIIFDSGVKHEKMFVKMVHSDFLFRKSCVETAKRIEEGRRDDYIKNFWTRNPPWETGDWNPYTWSDVYVNSRECEKFFIFLDAWKKRYKIDHKITKPSSRFDDFNVRPSSDKIENLPDDNGFMVEKIENNNIPQKIEVNKPDDVPFVEEKASDYQDTFDESGSVVIRKSLGNKLLNISSDDIYKYL